MGTLEEDWATRGGEDWVVSGHMTMIRGRRDVYTLIGRYQNG